MCTLQPINSLLSIKLRCRRELCQTNYSTWILKAKNILQGCGRGGFFAILFLSNHICCKVFTNKLCITPCFAHWLRFQSIPFHSQSHKLTFLETLAYLGTMLEHVWAHLGHILSIYWE